MAHAVLVDGFDEVGNVALDGFVVRTKDEDVEFVFAIEYQGSPTLVSANYASEISNSDCIK